MTAVMDSTEPVVEDPSGTPEEPRLPDASVLEDKTPAWIRTPGISVAFTVVIGTIFVILANRPLHQTDLWDHLNYGREILQTRRIPATEPLLPLAEGVPMVNVPWLAEVGMTLLQSRFGLSSLQFSYGFLIAASLAVVAWRATRRAGSAYAGFVAIAVFMTMNFHQFMVIRPQLIGVLFFSITAAWSLAHRRHSIVTWVGMPLMFAVWANSHASFSTGLLLLGLTAAGRFLDLWIRSRSLRLAISDPQFDRMLLLTQLCAAAVLLNPWGLAIYGEVFRVASNPNIQSMFEWNPLTLRMNQGQWAAVFSLIAAVVMKITPRRICFVEILPLTAMGLLALWSARMINWWAPLMAIFVATHLTASIRSIRSQLRTLQASRRTGLWTVVNLGFCWVFFAFTTFGIQLVHGKATPPSRMMSSDTPIQAVEKLNELAGKNRLPGGIAFVPAEWSGYVINAGPERLRPMVNLHVHLIPTEVWNDYLRIMHGPSDWDHLLDQYGINIVMVDKIQNAGLLKRLTASDDWSALYSDRQAAVFYRKMPI